MLPERFTQWFASKGWSPHKHQLDLLENASNKATLLIAPTGCGKTLAGFLPSLIDLNDHAPDGLHTLYVSPLKALAADIRRNLATPITELALDIRVEDRTGDTKQSVRLKQRHSPPHILLTTPESLALLLSYEDSPHIFKGLKRVIVDEIHALMESKRGDQLLLGLARLQNMCPNMTRVGLSATIDDPDALARMFEPAPLSCRIIHAAPGPDPDISILETEELPPWAGATGLYSAPEVMNQIRKAGTTLVFINTRAQAELFFQALWRENHDGLPIAIHHGSLSKEARAKVEDAMVAGQLRAIVCTASLDLGIDWGDVDLVIQVGGPKNVKRLVQRIGRSNHQFDTPSRALLVPANRFEVIECRAALEAVKARDLDKSEHRSAPLDVLCQHILLCACAAPFEENALFEEVKSAGPYRDLSKADFDQCINFCATGGYALRAYDRWQRLVKRDGLWQLRDPRISRNLRMNIGTIVQSETLAVRMRGGRGMLGEVEEYFASSLVPGDTFLIGGKTVRYEKLREMIVEVTNHPTKSPKIAIFSGLRMAMSLELSQRVVEIFASPDRWHSLPKHTQDWLQKQQEVSELPRPGSLLSEVFWQADRAYLCLYSFAGRNANQTLGLLLTRRMEDAGLDPTGFVSTDHAVLIWGLKLVENIQPLLEPDGLRNGLDTWLGENAVMKRSFRTAAIIAGLIERNMPGKRKTGRQATFSSDILYDTLKKYDPDHLLMQITKAEAQRGLVDFNRIEVMLKDAVQSSVHIHAPHVTPLAAPLLLEVGKVPIKGAAQEKALDEETARIMAKAGLS